MWFVRLGRSFPFAFVFFFREENWWRWWWVLSRQTNLFRNNSFATIVRIFLTLLTLFSTTKKLFQKALLLLLLATVQSLNLVLRPHFFRLLFWNANLEIKDFLWHGTIWKTYKNEIKRLVYKVFSSIFFNFLLKTNRSTLPERLSFFSSINVLFVLQFNFTAFFGPHPECPPPLFCLFC